MHSVGRRLKAARALGGYTNPRALSDALHLPNFGERTIREVEADRRTLHDHEAQSVADLVGVAPAFFTIDLRSIDEAPDRRDVTLEVPPLTLADGTTDDIRTVRAILEQALAQVDQVAGRAASEATTTPVGKDRPAGRRGGAGG